MGRVGRKSPDSSLHIVKNGGLSIAMLADLGVSWLWIAG